MRPIPDLPFSRKPSDHSPSPSLDPRTTTPATFFLSRRPHVVDQGSTTSLDSPEDVKENMYGVRSLDASLSQSEFTCLPRDHSAEDNLKQATDDLESHLAQRRSALKPLIPGTGESSFEHASPIHAVSRPLTPLTLGIPDDPSSLPSSPKSISNQSLRPLDDISITDEINSQAVGSGDEDEMLHESPFLALGGASQLIMPSIKMPSRRPFTERGKAMGRFKILLAGSSGSGKTSLIKSIVQTCDDIVHVDTIPQFTSSGRRRTSRPRSRGALITTTEIYASTRPYPSWWSDLEDSRVLQRRKSIGEIVLERNLCFVDTPAANLSCAGQTDAIGQYMRQQFWRATNALNGASVDFQNLLAGNGGSQVDAILYLISNDTLSTDVECIRQLCELSNVIPIISKADTLTPTQITQLKLRFHEQAREAGIKPFLFGEPPNGLDGVGSQPPYAVSSEKTIDTETMDASTLMSPDYVQPLVPSELGALVNKIFDRDNLAWMRHSAAKKLLQQRTGSYSFPPPIPLPSAQPAHTESGSASASSSWRSVSGTSISPGSPPGYAMARIADYTRHEERIAQVRLAQWATDLQRSLQNERDRYTSLARGERVVWLTERLGECVIDGSLVPLSQTPGFCGLHGHVGEKGFQVMHSRAGSGGYRFAGFRPDDPLGVVGWIDDLGHRSWVLVQIVGSVGVVGGLALWLARTWGLPTRSLSDLRVDYWCGAMER
ncbi:uncharacterized protein N7479_006174 [Penicillium vulpinum]|uniref:Septin-type G domain-containing protein n=1 Tax=Penicillium vulpinum TaxID=29845 RepID=A0A1V6SFJ2_9EURO|nr:uncharacterized protein N7479_006174 [Penicillium vulpinum]KAJ5959024.1 hypothetical protein N7479_006174 [Penicillium vulpinum]OQE12540.1 hypothetical protein PENVUL_c001G02661 [Penicillium vulpinum]